MKDVNVKWFTGGAGCVGVVRIIDEFDGAKYYIGVAEGDNEDEDVEHIMGWGSRFPKSVGDVLFGVTNETV